MLWRDLHIRGIGAALGELVPVPSEAGLDRRSGQRAVSVARNTTGMDLAVRAGQAALASLAAVSEGALPIPNAHFHAAIWRGSRGIDFWSRASYVRARLGLPAGPGIATEINAMSNSLVGGIDLAARMISGSDDISHVLLTGGETFGAPAFDHLTTDHGTAYGDGGSALILAREPGLARVLATASYTDPTLEQLHRGHSRFLPAGTTEVGVEHVRERKTEYLRTVGTRSVHTRNARGIRAVMNRVLDDTKLTLDDLAWVVLPHYGHHQLETQCLQPLGLSDVVTLKHAGDQWGHVGPNDQIIGLTHLLARRAVHAGDRVALIGIGIGMTWTAVLLQIDNVPDSLRRNAPPLRWPWRSAPRHHIG
ncbi:3-oxoacyl-[acyl-carrier-protein] synthase III C-terminal domain-containing protein [Amycolatopsis sp. NPDC047767]|uniref:3-oxoacyl-[acyl-carrier-protein] synthase III C-terminal domain-containing protein n=1 Tax=Amycolatopsis sp. NPDC047767 TaxID=3156765 RepID=UPI003452EF0C